MKHSFLDFLCTSLIPELCAYISACSSRNIHLILISVAAVWTLPDKLAVLICHNLYLPCISAFLTIITLCVKLCIHYVFINVLHNRKHSRNIICHIRNLNIAYGSTRRKLLELGFKLKLIKCIYIFCHMNMITVCNIILICNTLYLSKTFLQTLYELINGKPTSTTTTIGNVPSPNWLIRMQEYPASFPTTLLFHDPVIVQLYHMPGYRQSFHCSYPSHNLDREWHQ